MTGLVDMPIGISLDQAVLLGWNNCFSPILGNEVQDFICIIASVGEDSLKIKALHEGDSLGGISPLAASQQQAQRVTKRINANMDLCTEATDTLAQGLFGLPP